MEFTLKLNLEEMATLMLWYSNLPEPQSEDKKLNKKLTKIVNDGSTTKH